jgi:hypothetical protein
MTHDELQKVRNALAVATTYFAKDRNVVLDAIVILNNALAEPPQRTWVGLTDDEIWQFATDSTIGNDLHADKFARFIEAKLKQKNGYAEEKNT